MEFKKGNINLCEQVAKAFSNALVEGDLIVPDTKPDMAEILIADARVNAESDECRGGTLTVRGQVFFTALYVPEDSREIKVLEQTFPFSQTIDVKCSDDAEFKVNSCVEHIGFTLVNSRKLSAKVMVALSVCGMQKNEYEPIIEVCGDDIESRDKKYSMYIPLSQTQTDITVSDILTVEHDNPDIGEILKVNAYITPYDIKVMTGKAMVHADLHINTVYSSADNSELVGVSHTVPFTEIVEAPGADEQSVVYVSYKLNDIVATCKGDLNGDTKIISIDAQICADTKVSRTVSEKIVDDCYMLTDKTEITRKNMKICEYITSENARTPVRTRIEAPKNVTINEVIDCCVKPLIRECTWGNGTADINGTLVVFLIYTDANGTARSAVAESDINWQKSIAEKCDIEADAWIESVNWEIDGNGVQILTNVGIYTKALKPRTIEIITDINSKEEKNSTKQPSMAICFAKDGDTLWSIAKKYRVRAEKIKVANKLENEKIEPGRRLLIPKA